MGELVVIGIIVLILFGPKRLPEIGSAIGNAIKEFKKATRQSEEQVTKGEEKN